MPVVFPTEVRVDTQPNSSSISAPIRVDEMRPMTKKQVLEMSGIRVDDSPLHGQNWRLLRNFNNDFDNLFILQKWQSTLGRPNVTL